MKNLDYSPDDDTIIYIACYAMRIMYEDENLNATKAAGICELLDYLTGLDWYMYKDPNTEEYIIDYEEETNNDV